MVEFQICVHKTTCILYSLSLAFRFPSGLKVALLSFHVSFGHIVGIEHIVCVRACACVRVCVCACVSFLGARVDYRIPFHRR